MSGRSIGYVRLQGLTWDSGKQLEGMGLDKVFTDVDSGEGVARSQLRAMLEFIREGDSIFVQNIDKLAQNLDDCNRIINDLINHGAKEVYCVDSGVLFTKNRMHFPEDPWVIETVRLMRFKRYRECQLESVS